MGLLDGKKLSKLVQPKKTPKKQTVSSVLNKLSAIEDNFNKYLIQYKDDYEVLHTKEQLENYVYNCEEIVALDTETDGVGVDAKLVGICLYDGKQKPCYIPIWHIDPMSLLTAPGLADMKNVKCLLEVMKTKKLLYHNAPFDLRIIKHNTGVDLGYPYWDTLCGAHLTNFDKNQRGLKTQYNKYVMNTEDNNLDHFADLFEDLTIEKLPINLVYIYAARDAWMTYKLYEYQKTLFAGDYKEQFDVFQTEVKITKVISDMEYRGVQIDKEYGAKVLKSLEAELAEAELLLREEIAKHLPIHYNVMDYKIRSNPAIKELLFKHMEIKIPKPFTYKNVSIDEDLLSSLNYKVCKLLLGYRKLYKQVNTYVKKLAEGPDIIHPRLNSFGAITGRFSSSNPNCQNISNEFTSTNGNKYNIRGLFVPRKDKIWISADYSNQEVCIAAYVAQDKELYRAFKEGKDIHAFMASLSFKVPYEECLEFRPDGTTNKEGKDRRRKAKTVTFGLAYGTSVHGLANNIGVTTQEAQEIMDKYFESFPGLKTAIDNAQRFGKENGYVLTLAKRIRPIPSLQQRYVIKAKKGTNPFFNPDLNSDDDSAIPEEFKLQCIAEYESFRNWSQRNDYVRALAEDNIVFEDNNKQYEAGLRQCFNSVIQGSASEQIKQAIINIYENERLRELGYYPILSIHDENIIEGPIEHQEEASKILQQCMLDAAYKFVDINIRSDIEFYERWK